MDLAHLGEFGLIDRIQKIVGVSREDALIGIGDDAAVFRMQPGRLGILTTDALVEGVHFDPAYTPWDSLGWKTLAINLSDIAAMGGIPRYAVVTLAVADDMSVFDVESLYQGIRRCGDRYKSTVVGGDTVRSEERMMVNITVLGDAEEDRVIKRSGARFGDLLCVTGLLGGSRTGLEALKAGETGYSESVKRFLEPQPRVKEAGQIIDGMMPTSMIDISDGLASEVGHLCRESGVGCVVYKDTIPATEEAIEWSVKNGLNTSEFVASSGEEYELLFTVEPNAYRDWQASRERGEEISVTVIGEITGAEEGIRIRGKSGDSPMVVKGWDHFSS